VVDALLGSGSRHGLPDEVVAWMGVETPVVSVDFPTGLDPDTGNVESVAFDAVETVTFSSLKTGHVCGEGPTHCGLVTVADIGIEGGTPSMYVVEERDALRPPRALDAHKWSAGAVLVVGGSPGLVGALTLSARAALNFGAGVVYMTSPQVDSAHMIAPEVPAIGPDEAERRLDKFDVLVAGPGLTEADISLALPLVRKASRVVLDAGALVPELLDAALEGDGSVVVTPHAAEFQRISGVGGGKYSTRSFAARRGLTVLHKGQPTLVTDGGPPMLVTSGSPDLATIGTGDVLAGMIGALWARGLEPMQAAVSAAYWHGRTGSELGEQRAVTAEVLAGAIGAHAW
jgi:hydroxyethylthiazole kinase-like uncharacterized protein yjeF